MGQRGYSAQDWINSGVHWVAAGSGVLTDADAAALHAFGNTDPSWGFVPGSPTFLWSCVNTNYLDAAPPVAVSDAGAGSEGATIVKTLIAVTPVTVTTVGATKVTESKGLYPGVMPG
jgi:hypothetical protein